MLMELGLYNLTVGVRTSLKGDFRGSEGLKNHNQTSKEAWVS